MDNYKEEPHTGLGHSQPQTYDMPSPATKLQIQIPILYLPKSMGPARH